MVAVEGWAEVSSMRATDLAKEFASAGVEAIICTDISKDGMLCGVNVNWTQEIADASGVDTIASGGVKDILDIKNCKANGHIAGVIVGKAFYEGKLDLEEGFKVLND
jgi:phosphoribosylformimino-5-aminoimidazole carboxamide ribotide isomerase